MKRRKEKEQVLKVTSETRDSFKGKGRGQERQPFNKAIIECFPCQEPGHFSYECPSWEKAKGS